MPARVASILFRSGPHCIKLPSRVTLLSTVSATATLLLILWVILLMEMLQLIKRRWQYQVFAIEPWEGAL